jgi:hypothetical protein
MRNQSYFRRCASSIILTLCSTAAYADISGTVFRDFNSNGLLDVSSKEIGITGVTVNAIDSAGNQVASTTSATDGSYNLGGLTSGANYRLEFIWNDPSLKPSAAGDTTTQFVTDGVTNANVGINDPAHYCQANPQMVIPIAQAGTYTQNTASSLEGMISVSYDHSSRTKLLSWGQLGATWGTAYDRTQKHLYISAVLKRHAGFGTGGIDAIYHFDIDTPSNVSMFKLSTLGVDVGTDPRNGGQTDLNTYNAWSHDAGVFEKVGRVGIGDVDLSEDGKTLYAVNIGGSELVTINVSTPSSPSLIARYPINNPGCVGAYRPWGMGLHHGIPYVGVVCEDASQAYVLKQDQSSGSFNVYTSLPLNYPNYKEGAEYVWKSWLDTFPLSPTQPNNSHLAKDKHRQPILSEIEFDVDGSLILSLGDRFGEQSGGYNYQPDPTDPNGYFGYSQGDIRRICNVNGSLIQEGGAGCPYKQSFSNVPNLFQYYFNGSDAGGHENAGLGGLAIHIPNGHIVQAVMDPTIAPANGLFWNDNLTGAVTDRYQTSLGELA